MSPIPPITVPYRVLPDDDAHDRPPPRTVRYLVSWEDVFTFHDEILGRATPPGVEALADAPPPDATAVAATIEPVGVKPWTYARVEVEYRVPAAETLR